MKILKMFINIVNFVYVFPLQNNETTPEEGNQHVFNYGFSKLK